MTAQFTEESHGFPLALWEPIPRLVYGRRYLTTGDLPRLVGTGGQRYCRSCGKAIGGRRLVNCSPECEQAAYRAINIEDRAVERDGEVCRICGLDMARLTRIFYAATDHFHDLWRHLHPGVPCFIDARSFWEDLGFSMRNRLQPYDVDHIHPISEGGAHALSNLRVLCQPCHRVVSDRGAHRRAKVRRIRKKAPQLRLWAPAKEPA